MYFQKVQKVCSSTQRHQWGFKDALPSLWLRSGQIPAVFATHLTVLLSHKYGLVTGPWSASAVVRHLDCSWWDSDRPVQWAVCAKSLKDFNLMRVLNVRRGLWCSFLYPVKTRHPGSSTRKHMIAARWQGECRSNAGAQGVIYKTSDPATICRLTSTTPRPLERGRPPEQYS